MTVICPHCGKTVKLAEGFTSWVCSACKKFIKINEPDNTWGDYAHPDKP